MRDAPMEFVVAMMNSLAEATMDFTITDPAMRAKYTFGIAIHSDWKPGSAYEGRNPKAPMPIQPIAPA